MRGLVQIPMFDSLNQTQRDIERARMVKRIRELEAEVRLLRLELAHELSISTIKRILN